MNKHVHAHLPPTSARPPARPPARVPPSYPCLPACPRLPAAHPWDAQARSFAAQLITDSGLANVTQRDIVVASAMEARGFLGAIYK